MFSRSKSVKTLTLACLITLFLASAALAYEPLVLDDGTAESEFGTNGNFLLLNRFTPEDGGYVLGAVQFQFNAASTGLLNNPVDIYVWEDDNDNPADGATRLALKQNVFVTTFGDWVTVELDSPIRIGTGKDILIGISGYDGYLNRDTTTSKRRSYFAMLDPSYPDDLTLPLVHYSNYNLTLIDDIDPSFAGNLLIRGIPQQVIYDPSPADGTTEVSSDITLSWDVADEILTCDLTFGESGDMASVATGLASPDLSWTPESLEPHVTYQWQVIGHTASEDVSGDIWSFRTTFEPEIEAAGLGNFVLASADLSGVLSPDVFIVVSEDRVGQIDLASVEGSLSGVSFDIECMEEVSDDQFAVLPLTVTFRLTSADLGETLYSAIEEEASADHSLLDEAILDNLTFNKIYADGTAYDLFGLALDAAPEEADELFLIDADENGYTVILDLAIVDGETGGDPVQVIVTGEDRFFLVYDGLKDGRFHDPLVVTEATSDGGLGSGGSCNVGFSPAAALLLLPLLGLLKKR